MIKQLRSTLNTAALAMTPFLLSGCGPDDGSNKRVAEVVTVVLCLVCVAAARQLKTRHAASGHAG
jgi:hypothetical protein